MYIQFFQSADPFVKCYLVKCYCLSLYGCTLWSLSTSSVKIIEVSLNKILRKVWDLPRNSHTGILRSVAQVHTISNLLYKHFLSLHSHALSSSFLVRSIFLNSSQLVYTFSGYNYVYGHQHFRVFFLTTILIVPPLLEIFIIFMVFILLVKTLSGLYIVSS